MQGTVLVTGASRRIGAAIAEALAKAGWRVALHANRSTAECERVRMKLARAGASAFCVQGDLIAERGPERIFADALATAGTIDAIVNSAAVFGRVPLLNAGPEDFERAWRVNALAPILLTQCLARHLRTRGARGAAVNLLDQRIAAPSAGDIPYALSKKTLEAFTLSAARELAPIVRVNAVAPGAALAPEGSGAGELAGTLPLGRRPELDEIAGAVRFLLDAEAITGQTVFVDCGQHLAPQ